jgi:Helicase conserved C-terminal domain
MPRASADRKVRLVGRLRSKPTDTPNSLLALLQEMKSKGSWKALYLASATPMQMHAHEAWDLLQLLGLTPRWGSSAEAFVRYYYQLRESFGDRDWEFLKRMSEDFFSDPGVQPEPVLDGQVREALGMAGSRPIRKFHKDGLTKDSAESLSGDARRWFDEWLRHHTPTRERVFRTTRAVLRHYKAEGILPRGATIPAREVRDRFIPFSPSEEELYERIERYISRFYDAYMTGPKAQKPLGFIMTVYRRRLTSSFLAIERSLRRRREVLLGAASAQALLDPDDLAALEASTLFEFDDLPGVGKGVAEEARELGNFLAELAKRPPDESKMTYLHNELEEAFRSGHETAIVFTQYTDTMDYLRRQLIPWYGSKVVCYSGKGGERYDPTRNTWTSLTKTEVKNLFREGHEVKILIGTDSLSEGLNLQTCGKLINYDMPWNFMRVEQRIGRVDRINGKPIVEVSNYFYSGTVEEQIYSGIRRDYDWFQDVVGPAQPVLGQVESILEDVAMTAPGDRRDSLVQDKILAIRESIEQAKARAVSLQDIGRTPEPSALDRPAIDLPGLERVLLGVAASAKLFTPHESIAGAYWLRLLGTSRPVTFRRAVLDAAAPTVRLLTYGAAEMNELLRTLQPYWEATRPETAIPSDVATLDALESRLAKA